MSTSPPPSSSPPLPGAPIQSGTIIFCLSGGVNNPFPGNSFGGARSLITQGVIVSGIPSEVWDFIALSEAGTGVTEYRCIYVVNSAIGVAMRNTQIWFETLNTDPDIQYFMGLDPAGVNGVAASPANETTAPAGVVFSQPVSSWQPLFIGRLNAGDSIAFWIKRQVAAGALPWYLDNFVVRVEGAEAPQSVNVPDWGLAAIGNFSCASETAQLNINDISGRLTNVPPLQQFLGLGDLAVATTPTCWFNMTKAIDGMTKVVLGNEEITSEVPGAVQPGLLNSYLTHYHQSVPYYSYNYGSVHVLVLNTEILYTNPSPQYAFALADLKASSINSNTFWSIVAYHQPMYSAGGTGPDGTFVQSTWRDTYHTIFDTYNVDLVLTGHPYNYQRTFPILYNGVTPTTTASGSAYTNPGAPIMLNVGTGGQPLDSASLAAAPSYFAFTDNADFGYLWLAFSGNSTVCTGTFFNIANVAVDTFSISKP
jgi:hypothetical protein